MKILNKLLMATAVVVTLGSTVSCSKNNNYVASLPYTYFELVNLARFTEQEECTIEFNYTGSSNIEVYWDNLETPSTETKHTFTKKDSGYPYVIVKGDITSMWFAKDNGELLQEDNKNLMSIVFSNTITSLPAYSYYETHLNRVFIPKSVKNIGEYAFSLFDGEGIFCEAESCPESWNKYWHSFEGFDENITWGAGYYIFEDSSMYLLHNQGDIHEAAFAGFLFPDIEITEINIPSTIKVEGSSYVVNDILGVGSVREKVAKVQIPSSISYISYEAFSYCIRLKSVEFANKCNGLYISDYAFDYCAFEKIVLPEGLINVPYGCFEDCWNLKEVVIPSTVKYVGNYVFEDAARDSNLVIDLTAYKSKNDIAVCAEDFLSDCDANKITFKYSSKASELALDDFYKKGWPEAYPEDIVWEDTAPSNF